jgi:hypothetical protein
MGVLLLKRPTTIGNESKEAVSAQCENGRIRNLEEGLTGSAKSEAG